jgi:L-aminopeptidase/D-esterase-like protein
VINALGSLVHPATGNLYATSGRFDIPLLYHQVDDEAARVTPLTNTTLGVVATNAQLEKPQLVKVADLVHDGLARAIRPMHAMRDGDTVFALSTHAAPAILPDTTGPNLTDLIGHAAADAIVLAVLDAAEQTAGVADWPSVADAQAAIRNRG